MAFPRQNAETGWAYRGSQRHVQAYVNSPHLRVSLEDAIRASFDRLSSTTFDWKCPLQKCRYEELDDNTLLPAIGHERLVAILPTFWPRGGPSWDAVATAERSGEEGAVVLIEAKANLAEFNRGHRRAKRRASRELIDQSLAWARKKLGATGTAEAWIGADYQLANRLTWTLWLREANVDAVFVHLFFENDCSYRPISGNALRARAAEARKTLGVPQSEVEEWAANVVMPAVA